MLNALYSKHWCGILLGALRTQECLWEPWGPLGPLRTLQDHVRLIGILLNPKTIRLSVAFKCLFSKEGGAIFTAQLELDLFANWILKPIFLTVDQVLNDLPWTKWWCFIRIPPPLTIFLAFAAFNQTWHTQDHTQPASKISRLFKRNLRGFFFKTLSSLFPLQMTAYQASKSGQM